MGIGRNNPCPDSATTCLGLCHHAGRVAKEAALCRTASMTRQWPCTSSLHFAAFCGLHDCSRHSSSTHQEPNNCPDSLDLRPGAALTREAALRRSVSTRTGTLPVIVVCVRHDHFRQYSSMQHHQKEATTFLI